MLVTLLLLENAKEKETCLVLLKLGLLEMMNLIYYLPSEVIKNGLLE